MSIQARVSQKGTAASLLALMFLLAACGTDSVVGPTAAGPDAPLFSGGSSDDAFPVGIELCKLTPGTVEATWADFEVSAPVGEFPLGTEFRIDALAEFPGGCAFVWLPPEASTSEDVVSVTITEVAMTPGMSVDVVSVIQPDMGRVDYWGQNSVSVDVSGTLGAQVIFKNSGTPDDGGDGGAGCTPGFWRQTQHFQYWTGHGPGDAYAAVFGVDRAGTLLDNVWARGGGASALARHAVAALLNATSSEVDYDLSAAEIIAGVQAAHDSGDFESFKNTLEGFNEQGCTVDKSS